MINVAKLLKDAPKGMKLYSPLFGEVTFVRIDDQSGYPIDVTDGNGNGKSFTKFGVYFAHHPDAECLLFPSKDCRTWEGRKASKPHYDIINFKPFDKVLVRDCNSLKWTADLFSYIDDGFVCTGGIACRQCIPYNDDTKHLLGTTDMCDEQYINW